MVTQVQSTHSLSRLNGYTYINLTTFRKSGAAVATPLWFAEHQGILYAQTFPSAGKLKRIRYSARVTMVPSAMNGKALGAEIEGEARIVVDEQEIRIAEASLAKKYGLTRRIYFGMLGSYGKLRRQAPGARTYIAIEPVTIHSPHFPTPLNDLSTRRSISSHSFVPLFLNW